MKKRLKIQDVIATEIPGSYFFEDLAQIRSQHLPEPVRYHSLTNHNRFPFIRSHVPCVSIGVVSKGCPVIWGDAVPVSFAGKSGRRSPRPAVEICRWVKTEFKEWLMGVANFDWPDVELEFQRAFPKCEPFVTYGVSQVLVQMAAVQADQPLWVVIQQGLGGAGGPAPVFFHGSCGRDFYGAVDKMLFRKIPYLPQGQFEDIERQIGKDGLRLIEWVQDFKVRSQAFGYVPTLTLDFHGALDEVFSNDLARIATYLASLGQEASPHRLHIESPISAPNFETFCQRQAELSKLVKKLCKTSTTIALIADEWANTLEEIKHLADLDAVDGVHIKMPDVGSLYEIGRAVQQLKHRGKFSLLGGSCTETFTSSKISVHLAMATGPDATLVKPGMGFDEGFSLMAGESSKSFAEFSAKI
jgi:methylaspartate ammonia-lyase